MRRPTTDQLIRGCGNRAARASSPWRRTLAEHCREADDVRIDAIRLVLALQDGAGARRLDVPAAYDDLVQDGDMLPRSTVGVAILLCCLTVVCLWRACCYSLSHVLTYSFSRCCVV